MSPQPASSTTAYGYLTIVTHGELGYFGGLLVIDGRGRPLEFHCTTPVRPTRAQEILFGPTLRPYFWGEQIGGALVGQCQTPLTALLIDQEELRCVQELFDSPVVMLRTVRDNPSAELPEQAPHAVGDGPDLDSEICPEDCDTSSASTEGKSYRVEDYEFDAAQRGGSIPSDLPQAVAELAAVVDLSEPFLRVREAIQEAHRVGWKNASADAEAA